MALRVTQFRSRGLDLRRIREIRADVVATILVPAQSTRGRDELTSTVATLTQLDRYEQRARACCEGACAMLSEVGCVGELNQKWKLRRPNPRTEGARRSAATMGNVTAAADFARRQD